MTPAFGLAPLRIFNPSHGASFCSPNSARPKRAQLLRARPHACADAAVENPAASGANASAIASEAEPQEPPTPGKAATCATARRLALWLAADWGNMAQAIEDPHFWSHIHVVFRPLPWTFTNGYSFYSESAYDYALGRPYKNAVYRIVEAPEGALELECYKLRDSAEFWLGAHEPEILDDLTKEHLELMPEACNTIYRYEEGKNMFRGRCRPGNKCVVRRAGRGPPTYVDSTLELEKDRYSAWDLGRDPETHKRVWGTAAGPFEFVRVKDLAHLVPDPGAAV